MRAEALLGLPRWPLDTWVNHATQWLLTHASGFFNVISSAIGGIDNALASALHGIPEVALMAIVVLLAWEFVGLVGALGTFVGLGIIDNLGLWSPMLDTLALTLTAGILALAIAVPLGIWAGLNPRREGALKPVLDFTQTMPPYVYLIPAVMFFSTGAVPAVVSTVIFATAPPIRLTALGLRQVPSEMVEVGSAFGATRWQLLRKVQLPLALPSIMAGVNQCIMLSLSMVIIASLIGAKGLGQNIVFAIQEVQVGTGFVGGVAVVLLAIILDRITHGMGHRLIERRGEVSTWKSPISVLVRTAGKQAYRRSSGPVTASTVPVVQQAASSDVPDVKQRVV